MAKFLPDNIKSIGNSTFARQTFYLIAFSVKVFNYFINIVFFVIGIMTISVFSNMFFYFYTLANLFNLFFSFFKILSKLNFMNCIISFFLDAVQR